MALLGFKEQIGKSTKRYPIKVNLIGCIIIFAHPVSVIKHSSMALCIFPNVKSFKICRQNNKIIPQCQ